LDLGEEFRLDSNRKRKSVEVNRGGPSDHISDMAPCCSFRGRLGPLTFVLCLFMFISWALGAANS
jgi:hypothetical protein